MKNKTCAGVNLVALKNLAALDSGRHIDRSAVEFKKSNEIQLNGVSADKFINAIRVSWARSWWRLLGQKGLCPCCFCLNFEQNEQKRKI